MKNIKDILLEKLTLNKDSKNSDHISNKYLSINKNSSKDEIVYVIKELNKYADKKDLKIMIRNYHTNTGDFCIFVYDKLKNGRYLVGYDGDWDSKNCNFQSCYEQSKKFIDEFKR